MKPNMSNKFILVKIFHKLILKMDFFLKNDCSFQNNNNRKLLNQIISFIKFTDIKDVLNTYLSLNNE